MEIKVCTKCNEEKSLDRFSVETTRHGKLYIRKQCKSCRIKKLTSNQMKVRRQKLLKKKPLYDVWTGMIARCYNPNNPRYHRYGGRGIQICKRWLDYTNFEWDMMEGYKKGLQLDRVDNNGNYKPENCKWSTPREQSNNRSDNRYFEFEGENLTIPAWSRKTGIKRSTLSMRLYKYNWSTQKALTTI